MLACRWERTLEINDQLFVMISEGAAVGEAAKTDDGRPDGYAAGGATLWPARCDVRDQPDALISVFSRVSMTSPDEMWKICDAVVPAVRRTLLG